MPLLLVALEAVLVCLGAWWMVFETVLYLEVPSIWLQIAFPVAAGALCAFPLPGWVRRCRCAGRSERRFAMSIAGVAAVLVAVTLVSSRPDPDDVGYFRGPLIDSLNPNQAVVVDPFFVPFMRSLGQLPVLNENEVWEPLVVAVAQSFGVDALKAYHNLGASFGVALWALVLALLFRHFRVPASRAWACVACAAALLLLDGNLHQTFGNMSLLRMWQGKVIAYSVMLPAVFLLGLRLLSRPSLERLSYLLVAVVVSVSMNRSMLFLLMLLGFSLGFANLLSFGRRRSRIAAIVVVACVVLLVLVGVTVAVLVDSAPTRAAAESGPETAMRYSYASRGWHESVFPNLLGSRIGLLRDLWFLLVLPWFALARPQRRLLPIYSVVLLVLGFGPLTGSLVAQVVGDVQWRLYYALPLPLCFGLLVARPAMGFHSRRLRTAAVGAVAVAATLFGAGFRRAVLSEDNQVALKGPWELRFAAEPLYVARDVAPLLEGERVLATSEVATVLSLLQPTTVDLIYERLYPTSPPSAFRTEGILEQCHLSGRNLDAMELFLRQLPTAILMSSCGAAPMSALLDAFPRWELVPWRLTADYSLFRVHARGDSAGAPARAER